MILGAILAGGEARRFGSDKAMALLDGVTLIDRIATTLRPQVDDLVLSGRPPGIPDRPAGIGPLGGIAAALHHAQENRFTSVVTVPCDTPLLPDDLVANLAQQKGACFVADLPVIGWWPASMANVIDAYLQAGGNRSIRSWGQTVDATPVSLDTAIANINTRADLAMLARDVSG